MSFEKSQQTSILNTIQLGPGFCQFQSFLPQPKNELVVINIVTSIRNKNIYKNTEILLLGYKTVSNLSSLYWLHCNISIIGVKSKNLIVVHFFWSSVWSWSLVFIAWFGVSIFQNISDRWFGQSKSNIPQQWGWIFSQSERRRRLVFIG